MERQLPHFYPIVVYIHIRRLPESQYSFELTMAVCIIFLRNSTHISFIFYFSRTFFFFFFTVHSIVTSIDTFYKVAYDYYPFHRKQFIIQYIIFDCFYNGESRWRRWRLKNKINSRIRGDWRHL